MNVKIYKWNFCIEEGKNYYFPMKEDEYCTYNGVFVDYEYSALTGIAKAIGGNDYLFYINGYYVTSSYESLEKIEAEFYKCIKQKVFE